MATYTMLQNGSRGDDVKKLQETLIKAGYNVGSSGADGIYGNNTAAAVRAYQKANGLKVDGIAGDKTLGKLYGGSTTTAPSTPTTPKDTTPTTPTTTPKDFKYDDFKVSDETTTADKNRQDLNSQKPSDFTYADYEKSEIVKQAEAMLQQQLANKPGEYQSNWQTQLDETLNKILNREKFTYDLNGDALYQQYKDQYMLQGQQAMMDTMGQAQAMTGGYGNSYAQTVGQQTYQGYLQQLNDKVPELYQVALDQYNREGQDLYNQYGLYADRENQDYGRYRDTVSDYYTDLDYLTNEARYQAETDYGKYVDDKNFKYGQHRDEVTDWKDALDRADSEYWNQYNRDYGEYIDDKDFKYGQFIDNLEYDYKVNRDAITDADTAKKYAYETAMGMLSMGVTPSAQMLAEAGISSADAQAIANKVLSNEAKASAGNSGGSGGSGGTGGNGGYDNGTYSSDVVKQAQLFVGASDDGKWGANSAAKAKEKGYNSLAEVVAAMENGDTGGIDASYYGKLGANVAAEAVVAAMGNDGSNRFTGSTYDEAVSYMRSKGLPNGSAAGMLDRLNWAKRRNYYQTTGIGDAAIANYSTYEEYLQAYVEYQIEENSK